MNIRIRKIIVVMSLCVASIAQGSAGAATVGTSGSIFQGRDLDGNRATIEAYYDPASRTTWLADANYAMTSGYDGDGRMSWSKANAWAAGLSLGGFTNWRLPTVDPLDGTTANDANTSNVGTEDWGYNISAPGTQYSGSIASEMAYLFFNSLGNVSVCDPSASTVSNCEYQSDSTLAVSPFSNFPKSYSYYWSATGFMPSSSFDAAWVFFFNDGLQLIYPKEKELFAWAVHSGDVGVPTDADGDEVNTASDLCPKTQSGKLVDPGNGCSLDELVPCSGPMRSGRSWSSHGQYVTEYTNAVTRFVDLKLIDPSAGRELISVAERSKCGM